jgi:hypothetical protein
MQFGIATSLTVTLSPPLLRQIISRTRIDGTNVLQMVCNFGAKKNIRRSDKVRLKPFAFPAPPRVAGDPRSFSRGHITL